MSPPAAATVPAPASYAPPATWMRRDVRRFYRRILLRLTEAGVPFLVGGGYALVHHAGIQRPVKDLDLFLHPRDLDRARAVLEAHGWRTELPFPHWLAKVRRGADHVDLIFGAGNGVAGVDDEWFTYQVPAEVLGLPVGLCPPEETIWSKAFVMERERYDGGDVIHLLRAQAATLDWARLLRRFGPHWRVLFSDLLLFGFVYPGERAKVPVPVMRQCLRRLERELAAGNEPEHACQGTLLSRAQYLVDTQEWGYEDARVVPRGSMTEEETAIWTAAISEPAAPGAPAEAAPAAPITELHRSGMDPGDTR